MTHYVWNFSEGNLHRLLQFLLWSKQQKIQQVSVTIFGDRFQVQVAPSWLEAELHLTVSGFPAGERATFTIPVRVLYTLLSRARLSACCQWTLSDSSPAHLVLGRSGKEEISLAILDWVSMLEGEGADRQEPLRCASVSLPARLLLREFSSLLKTAQPQAEPDIEGLLLDLEIWSADRSRLISRPVPDQDIGPVFLRAVAATRVQLQLLRIPVEWRQLGGLLPLRQTSIPGAVSFLQLLRRMLFPKEKLSLSLTWHARSFLWTLDWGEGKLLSFTRYLSTPYLAQYENLLRQQGTDIVVAKKSLQNQFHLLQSSYQGSLAEPRSRRADDPYRDCAVVEDRGNRLGLSSGAMVLDGVENRVAGLLDGSPQDWKSRSLSLAKGLQVSGTRLASLSTLLQSGGVSTALPVLERGSTRRFRKLCLSIGKTRSLMAWASRKDLEILVTEPAQPSDRREVCPLIVVQETPDESKKDQLTRVAVSTTLSLLPGMEKKEVS